MTGMDIWQQILIGIVASLIGFLIVSIIEFIIEFNTGRPITRELKILLIILVTFVILFLLFCCNKPQPFPESPQIQITDPKEGDYVPWQYTVKGTSNLSPNSDLKIYVFIYAHNWYAQPKAVISLNGDWETKDKSKFGERIFSGLNYTYDVCAIVTTEDFKFNEQFANLPDYIAKSVTIKVTRK
jgi:hypothetical protein